jgi:hypothetical protein
MYSTWAPGGADPPCCWRSFMDATSLASSSRTNSSRWRARGPTPRRSMPSSRSSTRTVKSSRSRPIATTVPSASGRPSSGAAFLRQWLLSARACAGGFVAVGEPYWLTWPLPPEFDPDGADYLPLAETVTRFEDAGLALVTLIASSPDDWDRYESLQWLAVEEWVHDHPSDPDAERFREMSREYRDRYLNWLREMLGWGIFVGRKRGPPVGGGAP